MRRAGHEEPEGGRRVGADGEDLAYERAGRKSPGCDPLVERLSARVVPKLSAFRNADRFVSCSIG